MVQQNRISHALLFLGENWRWFIAGHCTFLHNIFFVEKVANRNAPIGIIPCLEMGRHLQHPLPAKPRTPADSVPPV